MCTRTTGSTSLETCSRFFDVSSIWPTAIWRPHRVSSSISFPHNHYTFVRVVYGFNIHNMYYITIKNDDDRVWKLYFYFLQDAIEFLVDEY